MRFTELKEDEMNDVQLAFYREVCAGPRKGMKGPFFVFLHAPELAKRAAKVGDYVRYQSSLPSRISEFAILITARYWTQPFEWHEHSGHALKAGLDPALMAELAQGRRPSGMKDDEAAAYQFCTELHQTKNVSDATFNAAVTNFGVTGTVELIGLLGYYTMISMALNVTQKELPAGTPNPLPPLA